MKTKWILGLLVFVSVSTIAQVQRKVTDIKDTSTAIVNDEMQNKKNVDKKTNNLKLAKELNLTKEQKAKLKEIRQANISKRDAVMNDATLTEAQKQDKLKELKRAAAADLQGILSDEQKATMKKMRSKKRDSNHDNEIKE